MQSQLSWNSSCKSSWPPQIHRDLPCLLSLEINNLCPNDLPTHGLICIINTESLFMCLHGHLCIYFGKILFKLFAQFSVNFTCQLCTNLESSGKRAPQLKNCLKGNGLRAWLQGIYFIVDWGGRVQPTVAVPPPPPGKMVSGGVRKQAEQEEAIQHAVSPIVSAPGSCWALNFLDEGWSAGRSNKSFPLHVPFVHGIFL